MSRQLQDRADVVVSCKSSVVNSVMKPHDGLAIERSIRSIAQQTILVKQYPRTQIIISVQELQGNGSLLASAINASCFALLDSGLAMSSYFAAVSIACKDDDSIVLDPDAATEQAAEANLCITIESSTRKCISCHVDGSVSTTMLQKCIATATTTADELFEYVRSAMNKKYSRIVDFV